MLKFSGIFWKDWGTEIDFPIELYRTATYYTTDIFNVVDVFKHDAGF